VEASNTPTIRRLTLSCRHQLSPIAQAFEATLADPQFVAEARKTRMEVQPMAPDAIEKLVGGILRTPRPVVERARILLGAQNR
jgi:hypothetical protein